MSVGLYKPGITLEKAQALLIPVVRDLFPDVPFKVWIATDRLYLGLGEDLFLDWGVENRSRVAGKPIRSTYFYGWLMDRILRAVVDSSPGLRVWNGKCVSFSGPSFSTFLPYMAKLEADMRVDVPNFTLAGLLDGEYESCPVLLRGYFGGMA